MQVINVHQRLLQASPEKVSDLLATLGSAEDRVWPRKGWPRMRLDAPLGPGASGGHGPGHRWVCTAHDQRWLLT